MKNKVVITAIAALYEVPGAVAVVEAGVELMLGMAIY